MKKLLEELKILDLACYDEIWRWALWLEDPDFEEYEADDPEYLKHRDDVIQGCVQRVIEARGWAFHIAFNPSEGPTKWYYQAFMWPEMICKSAKADTPAKAILTAYIAARKAQPCHL